MKANKNLKDSIQKGIKHSLLFYGFQTPPLSLPKFRLGADSAAGCAKRDGQRS